MKQIKDEIEKVFFNSFNETCKFLKIDNDVAFLEDSFTGIVRTRTTAELCSAMIKLQKLNKKKL